MVTVCGICNIQNLIFNTEMEKKYVVLDTKWTILQDSVIVCFLVIIIVHYNLFLRRFILNFYIIFCIGNISLKTTITMLPKYFTECPPGYTGMECAYRCHYPTYGEDCFMKCECSVDLCDSVSGCKYISTVGNGN